MHYFMHQFDKDEKTLSQEASTLGIPPEVGVYGQLGNGTPGITVTDPMRGETYIFVFYCTDTDSEGDKAGWRFVITMDTVTKYPHMQGHRVLIIND